MCVYGLVYIKDGCDMDLYISKLGVANFILIPQIAVRENTDGGGGNVYGAVSQVAQTYLHS